jgi:hypothetical protein
MSKPQIGQPRKPATKFAHLRKKLEDAKLRPRIVRTCKK